MAWYEFIPGVTDTGCFNQRRSVRVGTLALVLHLIAFSLVAVAQPTGKVVHRIGFLRHFACADDFGLKDLRQRLGELVNQVRLMAVDERVEKPADSGLDVGHRALHRSRGE